MQDWACLMQLPVGRLGAEFGGCHQDADGYSDFPVYVCAVAERSRAR